jgi:AAA+ ATPase superfamily predicted ATPase
MKDRAKEGRRIPQFITQLFAPTCVKKYAVDLALEKSIYTIDDPFLRFWFCFVFSERSALELGLAKRIWKEKISKDYDSVLGLLYEDVVRQELRGQWESWLGWEPARIGQYWDAQTEVDIVAENLARDRVAFFECKWSLSVDVEKELRILQGEACRHCAFEAPCA